MLEGIDTSKLATDQICWGKKYRSDSVDSILRLHLEKTILIFS